MQYVISRAHKADIPTLMMIFRESICGTSHRDYTPEQIHAWVNCGTPTRFLQLFDRDLTFYKAELDANCMGYASVSPRGDLHSMFVLPQFQRRRVATALLEQAMQFAQTSGASSITAEVSITALPFFERAGFQQIREQQVTVHGVSLKNYLMQWIHAT